MVFRTIHTKLTQLCNQPMQQKIKIAIAEDHKLLADSMTQILNTTDDIQVEYNCYNGQELLTALEEKIVDVILLDLDMPILDGREALNIIRKKYGKKIKIIILSMHYTDSHVYKYMKVGANSYLPKNCDFDILSAAVREVYESGVYFHDKVSVELMQKLMDDESTTFKVIPGEPLSKSEIQIVKLLCDGMDCRQISKYLCRSHRTIENHKYRLMKKLNIHSSFELMEYAIVQGIHQPNV